MERLDKFSGALIVLPKHSTERAQLREEVSLCQWVVEQVSKGFAITVHVPGLRSPLENRALINALPTCMWMIREVVNQVGLSKNSLAGKMSQAMEKL